MELVILKARVQLNRLVSREKRGRAREGRGGDGPGGARAGRRRSMAPAPAREPAPWLEALGSNASLAYNVSRFNLTFDSDYEQLNANSTDDPDSHWFCAKWTNAQQDLFQVTNTIQDSHP